MSITIRQSQQQLEQIQTQRQNGLTASQYLNQNGYNRALTQTEAAKISVFLPGQLAALNYGLEKGEIEQSDYDKAVKGEEMSSDGQTAFAALKERLSANFTKLMEYLSNNEEVGEKEEAFSTLEQTKLDTIMADGIVTDEELSEVTGEETEETEEVEEAEEAEEAEAEEPEEAGKPGRSEEVKAAFDAFMSDLEQGKDFDIKNHIGINEADYKGIVSDFKDDGIVGNGARREQFKDNTIYEHAAKVGKGITYNDKNGNKQTLKGVHDANDSRTHYFNEKDDSDKKKKEEV